MTPSPGSEHLCRSAWVLFWYTHLLIHPKMNNLNFEIKKFKQGY